MRSVTAPSSSSDMIQVGSRVRPNRFPSLPKCALMPSPVRNSRAGILSPRTITSALSSRACASSAGYASPPSISEVKYMTVGLRRGAACGAAAGAAAGVSSGAGVSISLKSAASLKKSAATGEEARSGPGGMDTNSLPNSIRRSSACQNAACARVTVGAERSRRIRTNGPAGSALMFCAVNCRAACSAHPGSPRPNTLSFCPDESSCTPILRRAAPKSSAWSISGPKT